MFLKNSFKAKKAKKLLDPAQSNHHLQLEPQYFTDTDVSPNPIEKNDLTLDWEKFFENEFPQFYQNQHIHVENLEKNIQKHETKKLKFADRNPLNLFENELQNTKKELSGQPERKRQTRQPVTTIFNKLQNAEVSFIDSLPIVEEANRPLFPPLGIQFSLLFLERNFQYSVKYHSEFPKIPRSFLKKKHFSAGSVFFFPPNCPTPDLYLQHLLKLSRQDKVGFYVCLEFSPAHHFFKICQEQNFPVVHFVNPTFFYVG